MYYSLEQRIRDKNNKPIGVMVADVVAHYLVAIGVSVCHKSDRFNMATGREIAQSRIKHYDQLYYLKDVDIRKEEEYEHSINKQLVDFMNRCSTYYRDKAIILPKIKFFYNYYTHPANKR